MDKVALAELAEDDVYSGGVSKRGSFLQHTGRNLFYAILSFTFLALLGLLLYLILLTPPFSVSPAVTLDAATSQALLDERHAVIANSISVVAKLIIACCLPL